MAVTLTSIDIYYNNNAVDCLAITDDAATYYIPWAQLSVYDREILTAYIDGPQFVQPLTKAQLIDPTKLLPNGMTAWSTYKSVMRVHPTVPETIGNLDDVYYDGAWKYAATGQVVP